MKGTEMCPKVIGSIKSSLVLNVDASSSPRVADCETCVSL